MRGANGRDESWTTGNIRVGNVPEVAVDLQERYGTSSETAIRLVAAASALAGSIKGGKRRRNTSFGEQAARFRLDG